MAWILAKIFWSYESVTSVFGSVFFFEVDPKFGGIPRTHFQSSFWNYCFARYSAVESAKFTGPFSPNRAVRRVLRVWQVRPYTSRVKTGSLRSGEILSYLRRCGGDSKCTDLRTIGGHKPWQNARESPFWAVLSSKFLLFLSGRNPTQYWLQNGFELEWKFYGWRVW